MKFADILKCAKAGISTDDVKAIQSLDNVSVDDAIEVIKAGYKIDDIKCLIDSENKETPPETPPEDDKETPPKDDKEIKELEDKIAKLTKDLESAQLENSRKDFGGGEKPKDTEDELVKLFADL